MHIDQPSNCLALSRALLHGVCLTVGVCLLALPSPGTADETSFWDSGATAAEPHGADAIPSSRSAIQGRMVLNSDSTGDWETGTSRRPPQTLEDLIELALEHNPSIQSTLAEVRRTRGMRWQLTRKPNPSIGYSASEVGNEGRAGQQGVFVSQEVVTANKLGLNDQVAGWEIQEVNWRWQEQKLRVTGDVRQRYYAVLAARQMLNILQELDAILASGVETTQRLLDAGEIGRGPLLQARLERQQNQLNLRNAQNILQAEEQALLATIGLMDLDLGGVTGTLDTEIPDLEAASTWRDIVQQHPRVESARAEVVRHQWNVQRQRVEPIPNVHSMFQLQHDNVTGSMIAGIQLGVALPVHNRNRGLIAAAAADTVRASFDSRQRELELRDQFVAVFRQYAVAREQVDTLTGELLPLARENLETVQELYRLGESSYLDLLTAQRTYVQSILSLIDARREAWQAVALIQSRLMSDSLAESSARPAR